jgi:D-alanyl-D-alanine carboxypeptidase (penicillin-binding protein 5/6)
MKQRLLLITALVLMIILIIVSSSFFSSRLISLQNTPTAPTPLILPTDTPTPTPTPTPLPSPTPTVLVHGSSAYLRDVTSGRVLLDVQSHIRVSMWSTTKIMTALLAIEHLPMDQIVTVEPAELNEVPDGMSIAYLRAGDQLSILHLLYGLLLPSGSDAAVVLAHAVSGTTTRFVALMNSRAAQLGLRDTRYTSPYGAENPENSMSAADLVKLATIAMRQPVFAHIVATPTFSISANLSHTTYQWTNILLPFLQGYSRANGIKTGSNAEGTDWCMVFSATHNGHLLIGAEMQAPSQAQLFIDAKQMLTRGFALLQ